MNETFINDIDYYEINMKEQSEREDRERCKKQLDKFNRRMMKTKAIKTNKKRIIK